MHSMSCVSLKDRVIVNEKYLQFQEKVTDKQKMVVDAVDGALEVMLLQQESFPHYRSI